MVLQPKVLIVDDDPAVRESLRALFEAHDFEASDFCSGLDFLNRFQENLDSVLILDINLPELDGFEILRRLRQESRSAVPVIMISGKAAPWTEARVSDAGADGFFSKPFDGLALVAAVKSLHEHRFV